MSKLNALALAKALGHNDFAIRSFKPDLPAGNESQVETVSRFQTFEDRENPPFDLIDGPVTTDPEAGENVPSQIREYRNTWYLYDDLTPDQKATYDAAQVQLAAPIVRGTRYTHNGEEIVVPDLSPRQWSLLLDASNSRTVLVAVLDAMPKNTEAERIAWAQLQASALNAGKYTWATTQRLVSGLRAQGVQGIPSDDDLLRFWMMAAEDAGL